MGAEQKVLEFNLTSERGIIATMIRDPRLRREVATKHSSAAIGEPKHRVMFRALARMAEENLRWSEATLEDLAGGEDYGGPRYVRELLEEFPEALPNVDFHLARCRLDSTKMRVVNESMPELARLCGDPKASGDQLVAAARRVLAIAEQGKASRRIHTPSMLVDQLYESLRTWRSSTGAHWPTGFPALDRVLTYGLAPGLLSMVAARPRVGKTKFITCLMRNQVALRRGMHVGAWEMHPLSYVMSMVAAEAGVGVTRMVREAKDLTDEERRAIHRVGELLAGDDDAFSIEENPFPYLDKSKDRWDLNGPNLDHFESTVAEQSKTKSLFILDVLMKMIPDRRPDAIAAALIRVRDIALKYKVHICMLHHVNRDGADGRPTLEHLKGAGAIEEDMDIVLALDRPVLRASSARRRKMRDTLDVHLLKQREGVGVFAVRYTYDPDHARLEDEEVVDELELDREDREDAGGAGALD